MSLLLLQKKLNIEPDGKFGPTTFKVANLHFKLSGVRAVHFWAQVSHETGEFSLYEENLSYSPEGLRKMFRKYFNDAECETFSRKPEKIANRVYANRMGNGNELTGDGWKFRGRGALQLTGRSNYLEFSKFIGKPEIMITPELVATEYTFESALFFFTRNKLWEICDAGVTNKTIELLTKRINGGTNGLPHRIFLTQKYYKYL